jgi:hypothetical protein
MYLRILCFGFIQSGLINITYVYLCTLLQQGFCDGQANTLRTSRHQCALAGELKVK